MVVQVHTRVQKMARCHVRVVLPFGFVLCLEAQNGGPYEDHHVTSLPTLTDSNQI
jgi:hypothetical protein